MEALSAWCRALAAAGVDGVQLRDRGYDDRERFERACAARKAFPAPGRLFVSGRADLALLSTADGVQLPAAGLPLESLLSRFGHRLLWGRSTHSVEEVERAREEGADFVLFGPVYETPSKIGRIAPRGISSLSEAARRGIPVVAIGGIDADRAPEIAGAGAWGFAAIRAFAEAERDGSRIAQLRRLWPSDDEAPAPSVKRPSPPSQPPES